MITFVPGNKPVASAALAIRPFPISSVDLQSLGSKLGFIPVASIISGD